MTICFITPEFVTNNYFSGGLANYVYRVSKDMAIKGHNVKVITVGEMNSIETISPNLEVHKIKRGKLKFRFNRLTRNKLKNTANVLDFSWEAYKTLKAIHVKEGVDIVQAANYRACGLFSILFFTKSPITTRISTFAPYWNIYAKTRRTADVGCVEYLESLQIKLSKHVFSPSELLKTIIEKDLNKKGIKVIRTPFYNEISANLNFSQKIAQYGNYLLFVGRLMPHKGILILADALFDSLSKHEDMQVVFAGLDCEVEGIGSIQKHILEKLSIFVDRIHFTGQLRHSALYPLMKHANLIVLPSIIDNFSNTMLESMFFEKPVIGTIGASFDELIIDGVNGYLVPIQDANKLSEKIDGAWRNKNNELIGSNAKKTIIDELNPDKLIPELLVYYKSIIK